VRRHERDAPRGSVVVALVPVSVPVPSVVVAVVPVVRVVVIIIAAVVFVLAVVVLIVVVVLVEVGTRQRNGDGRCLRREWDRRRDYRR
jgi:hypothetical protein